MHFSAIFVIIILVCVIAALIKDRMRPGLVLLSGAVVFLCAGIISPKEMLEGFSNKGMITVAMLFLVSEVSAAQVCSKRCCAVCCRKTRPQTSEAYRYACSPW